MSTYDTDSVKWASSSTGLFMDNSLANYIATNASLLDMPNPELYVTARLSPLSLRYHGFPLQKGNYNVCLHFAEIMLTDDQTFSGTGRRLFDVSIQGHKVMENFDIREEARGTSKQIIRSFDIDVEHTLEIHFYWAGKGTVSIPIRGVYGPLVSSVTPNFKPSGNKISAACIVGIVIGSFVFMMLVSIMIWIWGRRRTLKNDEFRGLELQTSYFSLKQIKVGTKNFDPANKIGEGGFWPVYQGVLPDGSIIAIKQLSSRSNQGTREFLNEIGMLSALQHP